MSLAKLLAVFSVDINCQLLRKDTGIPQYVLFVLSIQCLVFLFADIHVAPLLSQSVAVRTYGSHDSQALYRISRLYISFRAAFCF